MKLQSGDYFASVLAANESAAVWGSTSGHARRVRFASFEVDLEDERLSRNGEPVALGDRSFDVLATLLSRPARVFSRRELRDALWPGHDQEQADRALNTAVNKLRRSLGESASDTCYVETVFRRGYRFIAPVTVVEDQEAGAWPRVAAPAGRQRVDWRLRLLAVGALVMLTAGTVRSCGSEIGGPVQAASGSGLESVPRVEKPSPTAT